MNIIFEKSSKSMPIFEEIDRCFEQIKNNRKNKKSISDLTNQLETNIKKISGVRKVDVKIIKNLYNAYASPIYKKILPVTFNPKNNQILKRTVKKKFQLEETGKFISELNLGFGTKLLNEFTPQECTAVLLHELGHALKHTSFVGLFWKQILKKIAKLSIFTVGLISPQLYMASLLLFRGTSIFDHIEEYSADSYTSQYGYGDEMLRVLNKFKKNNIKFKKKNPVRYFSEKILGYLFGTTHPEDDKRQCSIINQMLNEYANMYPGFEKEIKKSFKNIKC